MKSKKANWITRLGLVQKIGFAGISLGIVSGQWWVVICGLILSISRSPGPCVQKRSSIFTNPEASASASAVLLPADRDVWVRGVGYRQLELAEVGVSAFNALLLPEPQNEFDSNAVMVCSGIPGAFIHIGYLPADLEVTALVGELAAKKSITTGHLLAAVCEISEKYDGSYIARIQLPFDETLEELISDAK